MRLEKRSQARNSRRWCPSVVNRCTLRVFATRAPMRHTAQLIGPSSAKVPGRMRGVVGAVIELRLYGSVAHASSLRVGERENPRVARDSVQKSAPELGVLDAL